MTMWTKKNAKNKTISILFPTYTTSYLFFFLFVWVIGFKDVCLIVDINIFRLVDFFVALGLLKSGQQKNYGKGEHFFWFFFFFY